MSNHCYCVTRHGAPLEHMEMDVPEPKGDQVLIRMTGAGVCHSDIHLWEGKYDLGSGEQMTLSDRGITLPLTMGHEITGEVVKTGSDVTGLEAGTNCVVYPWLGCGECPTCQRDEENYCPNAARSLGVFLPGGYAHTSSSHARNTASTSPTSIPPKSPPSPVPGVTTYSALKKFGDKIKQEPVVIIGAGGLGHMALAVLKAMGGKGAVFVDLDAAKRDAVVEAGALAAIDGGAADAADQIKKATNGGAHMVLDLVGSGTTIGLGIAGGTKGVQVVVVGLYGGEIKMPSVYFPPPGDGDPRDLMSATSANCANSSDWSRAAN